MIGHEVIPSYFVVEIEGSAVNLLFPESLNVAKVIIGSLEFPSDMHAISAAQKIVDLVCPAGEERVELNPDFFSLAPKSEEAVLDEEEETPAGQGPIITTPITRKFDELGDFVGYRKTITGNDCTALIRVLANPTRYISEMRKAANSEYDIAQPHRELARPRGLQ